MEREPVVASDPFGEGTELPDWLTGPADNADLPAILRSFAETVGRLDALRLAYALGGTKQNLSVQPSGTDAISTVIGQDRARALGRAMCGASASMRVTIPFGPFSRAAKLRLQVRRRARPSWSSSSPASGRARKVPLRR
ncbi:hypothetical protein [uncultured Methylobacterium sp.]|uniref:hypothetical protein n=1 Tax=uncultured Methylobacterium sp. TaxID=157278 RepID=UPI0035CA2219